MDRTKYTSLLNKLGEGKSRTTNSLYNFSTSIFGQFITILMQFIVRTVFIHTLGKSYLGINGLFSNLFSLLSLTEFGVGNAILFKLYKPIATEDHRRAASLMQFYKKAYRFIGAAITVIALCLIPFLPHLIKDYDRLVTLNINATVIFLLYLVKTVSSYLFFAYKSAIIRANQKEYIINLLSYLFTIASGLLQIILLVIYPNLELYILISVLQVLMQNIVVAVLANKLYPYINDSTGQKIDREEVREIGKDCSALFLYKLNGVVLKATDNMVLSVFLGLEMVGLYSNYYVFYTTINSLFNRIFGSVSHSLGNLHTTHDVKHEYLVFERVLLITAILGGTAFAGIFVVSDEFVLNWAGKDWQIPQPFSFLMGFELYTLCYRVILSKYRTTMGLFQQAKWRPLAGMIINLVVSVALVRSWGICGVLVGTIVADWTTFMWYDPLIIHKYGFRKYRSTKCFYKTLAIYTIVVTTVSALDYLICSSVLVDYGWLSVIVHVIICALSIPSILLLIKHKSQEGQYLIGYIKRMTKKLLHAKQ